MDRATKDTRLNTQDLLEAYRDELQRQDKSPVTITNYLNDIKLFAKWLTQSYDDDFVPSKIVQRDIVEYRSFLKKNQEASPATVNRRLASLSAFFRWCVATGKAETNPVKNIKGTTIIELAPRAIEIKNLRRLLREAHVHANARDIAIIETLCGTGLRVGELVALKLQDIEIGERSGAAKVRNGKGMVSREVPLNVDVRKAVQAYLEVRPSTTNQYLFIGQKGENMTTSGVWRIVKKYAEIAGMPQLRVHDLRHTALTRLVREFGTDLATVAKISGHRNLKTLLRYAQPTREDLAAAVEKLAFTDG
jgi:site-specific recombinase XerD